jgi:hypothetical protein
VPGLRRGKQELAAFRTYLVSKIHTGPDASGRANRINHQKIVDPRKGFRRAFARRPMLDVEPHPEQSKLVAVATALMYFAML